MYRIYLISLFLTRVSVTFIEKKYKHAHGMSLTTTLLWSDTSPSPSPLHCVATCSRIENCYAVGFSSVDLKCSYFHWFLGGEMSLNALLGEDTERVVLVKPVPVLHITNSSQYAITFNDSMTVCEKIGGRLTRYDELKNVWTQGYHRCSCGWLDNGVAYYPSQTTSSECGSAKQVNTCHGRTEYDVYCTAL